MHRRIAAVVAAVLSLACLPLTAGAQTVEPASAAVALMDATPWLGPDGTMRFALEIHNRSARALGDLRVTMSIHEAIPTRYGLQRSFGSRLGPTIGSDTSVVEGDIAPGQRRVVEVSKPVSEVGLFRSAAQGRSYPFRLTVRSGRTVVGTVDTYIPYLTQQPAVPLSMVLVVPLSSDPVYTKASHPSAVGTSSLEKAVAGRLERIVAGLEENPQMPVTIAPTGVLLDMLADMADGYEKVKGSGKIKVSPEDPRASAAARMLERIGGLAARPTTRVIATPYAMARLGGLVRNDLEDRAQAQVEAGLSRLTKLGPTEPLEGWLLSADGSLEERTVAALQRMRVTSLVVTASTVRQSTRSLTRGTPVTMRTRTGGAVTMLVRDQGLEDHLAGDLGQTTLRQRFLADAAIALQERPSASRVVTVATPVGWDPEPQEAARLFSTISASGWLVPTTPEPAVANFKPPASSAELEPTRKDDLEPGPDYFAALRDARQSIDRFSELGPPASRLAALEQRLLIAESGSWWSAATSDRGRDLARTIRPEVQRQFDKIKAPAPQTITLTSRDGQIPLLISSGLDYPANVVVRLDSDKLRFPDGDRLSQKLQPPNQQIVVKAVTRATGTFPLRVVIQTPESGEVIASTRLVIRSTAYNIVAVAITAGAAVFMIGFWLMGLARRKLAAA